MADCSAKISTIVTKGENYKKTNKTPQDVIDLCKKRLTAYDAK